MRIEKHKELIREIAPGVIQIGNNPFAPTLLLDDLLGRARVGGEPVVLNKDLDNISGSYLNYKQGIIESGHLIDIHGTYLDFESAIIASGYFKNRPSAENLPIMLEGDMDPEINRINNELAILNDDIELEERNRINDVNDLYFDLYHVSGVIRSAINEEELDRINDVNFLNAKIDIEIQDRIDNFNYISEIY